MTNIALQRLIFGNISFLHGLIFTYFKREYPIKIFVKINASNPTEFTTNTIFYISKHYPCKLCRFYIPRKDYMDLKK